MFVSALQIFLMVPLSGSINGLYQMFEILLSSYVGLDHAGSFEIIHAQIEDSEFVWYYLYVWLQILKRIAHTKILS